MVSRYKGIKVNGKKVDEHRWMMEQHLGRKLDRKEVVHHKNEKKRDNYIENFEVQSLEEHTRNHQRKFMNSPIGKKLGKRNGKRAVLNGFPYFLGYSPKFKDNKYWCNCCKKYLPKESFWKCISKVYKIESFCKDCKAKKNKQYKKNKN